MADTQAKVEIVTVDAVTDLKTLRETIKKAKEKLDDLTIGSEAYRKQLVELNKAQNLLTNAVNGTTAKEEDYDKALKGTSKTYNTLVKQMADMKKALRNIDVSTEQGAKDFAELAQKINGVNQELKDMDAMKGDFQRNVGNYKSAFEGWGDALSKMPGPIGSITNGVKGVNDSLALVGKQPILGIIGLLAPIITKIAEGLKENKSAVDGVKKAMDALKPAMDFFSGILETIGSFLGDILTKSASFLSSNGVFQKVISGVVGVGNAILQFIVAPFKGIAAAIGVFKEQGVKGLRDAARAFNDECNKGIAFKQNFKAGQAAGDAFVEGMVSKREKAKNEAKKTGKETADAWQKEMEKRVKEYAEGVKARVEAEKYLKGLRDATEKDIEDMLKSLDAENEKEMEALIARMEDEAEAERIIQEMSVKNAEEAAKKKAAAMNAYAAGVSASMTTIADILESSENASEAQVKAAKNLRIAAATIDMIQGAVTAFSTAQELGPIAGPIVGALNAATVVASGLANIAKIKSTNVSKDSAPSASPEMPTASAPVLDNAVPTTTVTEGSSQEMRLNRATEPQKVYILQDDIEAAGNASRVQVAESSF